MNRREALKVLTAALGSGVVLSACAPELPTLPAEVTPSAPVPNLSDEQVKKILDELSSALTDGDAAQDSSLLEARVKEPALTMRRALYYSSQRVGEEIPALNFEDATITVSNQQQWPRAILALTAGSADQLPAIVLLTQSDARSQYQMENWTRLFPGRSVATFSIEDGSPMLDPEVGGFLLSPKEALQAWVSRLNGARDNDSLIGEDPYTDFYQKEQTKVTDGAEVAGKVVFDCQPLAEPITAVQLGDGSALVAGAFTQTVTYERTVERATLKVGGGGGKALEESTGSNEVGDDLVTLEYLSSVFLRVPATGEEDTITALGAERWLSSVRRDEK